MTVFTDSHKNNPPFTDYLDVIVFDILPGSGSGNAGNSGTYPAPLSLSHL